MNKKLHVLIIPTWYPIGEDKLMGVYHKDFCAALNKRDDCYANILFIQRHRLLKPWRYIMDDKWKVIDDGSYHTYIKTMQNVSPISKTWQIDRYAKSMEDAFLKYVKINGMPDVLHAQVIVPAGYAAAKIADKYNIPLVITEHLNYEAKERIEDEPYGKYGTFAVKHGLYTGVSRMVIDIIEKDHDYGMRILPNSVDLSIFKSNELKKPNGFLDIVQVAALREYKGVDDLIDAVKILVEEKNMKNVHLNIVGDGFIEDYYKNHCKEQGMDDYVTFVGRKTRSEVRDYIAKSDMLVMAGYDETFAIPPIEAMAVGVPVVTINEAPCDEYMVSGVGETFTPKKADELADAILRVYGKLDEYDHDYIRGVAYQFSEQAVTDKAMEYYRELISQKASN